MIVDFHVHTAPGLMPRHHTDTEIGDILNAAGIDTYVLKAHEGSTAERAVLAGNGAVGAIVLNSPVGGANPDAVKVAAALGARVAWLPTVSAQAHQAARSAPELSVHKGISFAVVPVCSGGEVLRSWYDVFDIVAEHDMVLASGHVSVDETVALFTAARSRGVQRMLVNHPLAPFLGWRERHLAQLRELGAYLELGVLADLIDTEGPTPTSYLAERYPHSLLVFGSDLGHQAYPDVKPGIGDWLAAADALLGSPLREQITESNGAGLLSR